MDLCDKAWFNETKCHDKTPGDVDGLPVRLADQATLSCGRPSCGMVYYALLSPVSCERRRSTSRGRLQQLLPKESVLAHPKRDSETKELVS